MSLRWLILSLLVLGSFGNAVRPFAPAAAEPDAIIAGTLTWDGVERSYLLHLPPDHDPAGDTAIPLIVALHGGSSSPWTMLVESRLNDAADAAGQMVVYPAALGYDWGLNANPDDPDQQEDDIGFIGALIDQLVADYQADPARVYLVGYHDGGLMAYKFACVTPENFQAIAVVGPMLWEHYAESCPTDASASVNMLIMHGTDDPVYTRETHPFDIFFYDRVYTVWGVQPTVDFWLARNECDPDVMQSVNGVMNARAYTACADDTQVAVYSVIDGRENWPRTGDYTLNQFGLDATAMVMGFFAGDESWAETQVPFDDQARTYALYVPSSYDPAEPMPVMMVLHGRFGTGETTAEWTDMNRIAEENGFIAVYPDGLVYPDAQVWYDTGWNYMRGTEYSMREEPNDSEFLANVLHDMALDLTIDPTRVYVVGISNGGFMVHYLACHDPERYAAFADVMGSGYLGMETVCQSETPVPMMMVHGTYDDNILWNGITTMIDGREVYSSYPVNGVFQFWAVHNQCDIDNVDMEDLPQLGQSPNSSVRIFTLPCPEGIEMKFFAVLGGGHSWPGTADSVESAVENRINMDIDTGEELWAFFSRQQRDPALPQ